MLEKSRIAFERFPLPFLKMLRFALTFKQTKVEKKLNSALRFEMNNGMKIMQLFLNFANKYQLKKEKDSIVIALCLKLLRAFKELFNN